MFETVVPERVTPRSRKIFYETLPLSIALHVLAGLAILVGSSWDVTFPTQSPRMYAAFQLAATPPPPPPPPPLVRRTPITPQARAVQVKMPLVAPTIIPDEIPVVAEEEPIVAEIPVTPVAVDNGQIGGVEGGIEGGEADGQLGGTIGGLPKQPEPEVIQVKRDDPLPMGAISQEFPPYPEYALKRNWEDTLVVRYTVGKDGRIKEVKVIKPPEREEFSRQTIATIRHWRFHPYLNADGEAKEVEHELTVVFNIVRKKR